MSYLVTVLSRYARFITRFLASEGLVSVEEPFAHLLTQGMVQVRSVYSPIWSLCSNFTHLMAGSDGEVISQWRVFETQRV